jgi:hypothetical protein
MTIMQVRQFVRHHFRGLARHDRRQRQRADRRRWAALRRLESFLASVCDADGDDGYEYLDPRDRWHGGEA